MSTVRCSGWVSCTVAARNSTSPINSCILQTLFLLAASTGILSAALVNPSFEGGSHSGVLNLLSNSTAITNWLVDSGNLDWVASDVWQPHSGSYSVELNGTDIIGRIRQTVATTPGMLHEFSFFMSANPLFDGTARVNAFINSSPNQNLFDYVRSGTHSANNMEYVSKSFQFAATGTCTIITLETFNLGALGPVIDSAALTELNPVPEPSTAVLTIGRNRALRFGRQKNVVLLRRLLGTQSNEPHAFLSEVTDRHRLLISDDPQIAEQRGQVA